MKTRILLCSVLLLVLSFPSCYTGRPIVTKAPNNNQTYKIDYLFEHDGCKVYRFNDMGNYVYFTNCNGNVTAIAKDSTKHRVQTIVRVD